MGTLPFAMMPPPPLAKRLTANVDDFTLHADTAAAYVRGDGGGAAVVPTIGEIVKVCTDRSGDQQLAHGMNSAASTGASLRQGLRAALRVQKRATNQITARWFSARKPNYEALCPSSISVLRSSPSAP